MRGDSGAMNMELPAYVRVAPDQIGQGTPVRVRVRGDMADVARHMAQAMWQVIIDAQAAGRAATLIVPVGPVDQFPLLAQLINERRTDCREVVFLNMDEYLTDADHWIDCGHPLSF